MVSYFVGVTIRLSPSLESGIAEEVLQGRCLFVADTTLGAGYVSDRTGLLYA